jgi:hypothetical protein
MSWFDGTIDDWKAMPLEDRETIAFERTGCLYAHPTWERPVRCLHLNCRIARGELPEISRVNDKLRYERQHGWLRFITDRDKLATIFKAVRAHCMETGVYDAWQAWPVIVYGGISA